MQFVLKIYFSKILFPYKLLIPIYFHVIPQRFKKHIHVPTMD